MELYDIVAEKNYVHIIVVPSLSVALYLVGGLVT